MEKNYINYKDLKKAIAKSCDSSRDGLFTINLEKLTKFTSELGLVPITPFILGAKAAPISTSDIPNISNYLEGERLEWIDGAKSVMNIVFVRKDYEEALNNELDSINDNVKAVSTIVANYPCYFALIVGYNSNDPDRCRKLNYLIGCRANKIVLSEKYSKNDKDTDEVEAAEEA